MATLGDQAVGSIVKLNVNGSPLDFIVVHQGLPTAQNSSESYHSSCTGTWLLMEDIYELRKIYSSSSSIKYANSSIHSYLNNTFINAFDSDIRSFIKTANIPVIDGSKLTTLSAKLFLLSYTETGLSEAQGVVAEGGALSYFDGAADSKRIAYYNDTAEYWYTRSIYKLFGTYLIAIDPTSGEAALVETGDVLGIRPAMIFDTSLNVDSNGYVSVNTAPTTPGVPSVPSEVRTGDLLTISWGASTDANGNLSGYELQLSVNGGSWAQIYKGSSRSYTYTVPDNCETLAFRVRAYDSDGAYSSYATSATVTVRKGAISGTVNIGGVERELTGEGYVNIGGVLRELSDSQAKIDSIIKSLKG